MANVLPFDKQVMAISALTEGCSIRAVERLTGVHRDTISGSVSASAKAVRTSMTV